MDNQEEKHGHDPGISIVCKMLVVFNMIFSFIAGVLLLALDKTIRHEKGILIDYMLFFITVDLISLFETILLTALLIMISFCKKSWK